MDRNNQSSDYEKYRQQNKELFQNKKQIDFGKKNNDEEQKQIDNSQIDEESYKLSSENHDKMYQYIYQMFKKEIEFEKGKTFFETVRQNFESKYCNNNVVLKAQSMIQFKQISDIKIENNQNNRQFYEKLNKREEFQNDFLILAKKFFYNQELGVEFNDYLFNEIFDQIVTQMPFKKYDIPGEIYVNHFIKYKNFCRVTEKFMKGVDVYGLQGIANFVIVLKDDNNNIEGFGMCTNKDMLGVKGQEVSRFYNLTKPIIPRKNVKVCQLQVYVNMYNISKSLQQHAYKYNQDTREQYEIYLALAIVKKLFLECDFYGVPLNESEAQDLQNQISDLYDIYSGHFNNDLTFLQPIIDMGGDKYKQVQDYQLNLIVKKQFQRKSENDEFEQQFDSQMNVARIRVQGNNQNEDSESSNRNQDKFYFSLTVEDQKKNQFHQILENLILCFRFVIEERISGDETLQGYAQQINAELKEKLQLKNYSLQLYRKLLDPVWEARVSKYNEEFHKQFMNIASQFFQKKKFENQFDKNFYQIIIDNMVSNIPFQIITVQHNQFGDLFDQELIFKQNLRFLNLIDGNLVHLANYNTAFTPSKGVFMTFDTTTFPENSQMKDPSEYRFELAQRQINEKNEYQQVAIYMHYENMIKKIIKYQQMLGYQIKYVDFYIIFAMMEKYYLFPDFLGIPLSQNDLRNYQDSMIKIQQSYIRSFNPQYQQDYEPYKTNLRITKEKYSEFQNIQYQELKKNQANFEFNL